jgi:hypothetical protein
LSSSIERRVAVSAVAALSLCLVVVGQTFALGWAGPVPLTSASGYSFGWDLQATGVDSAVALYGLRKQDGLDSVQLRRTADAGRTWSRPVELAAQGSGLLAGVGQMLDVMVVQDGRVRYARSEDGGATLSDPIAVSPKRPGALYAVLAHDGAGFVGIAWVEENSDPDRPNIFMRRSLDDGKTFLPIQAVADTGQSVNPIQLAVGDGVIYLGYVDAQYRLRIRRSFDSGAHWTRAVAAARGTYEFELAANGDEAYATFETFEGQSHVVEYAYTTDRGNSWSDPRSLIPDDWPAAANATIAFDDGVLRAVITRCLQSGDTCGTGDVFYRQTTDGVTWSTPQRVSPRCADQDALADAVAYVGRVLVLYEGIDCTGEPEWQLFVRRRG